MESTYEVFVPCLEDEEKDIATALLSASGFSAFQDIPGGIKAYCLESDWTEAEWKTSLEEILNIHSSRIVIKVLPPENYNATWESSLEPVEIDHFVQILPQGRKPKAGFNHTLFITPKMSFGTGHHPTTRLMIRNLKENMAKGGKVLDLGSGTGILGILSARMGASLVKGIDIESWCTENATENAVLNEVSEICHFETGTLGLVPETETFQLIFANINRNILMDLRESLGLHLGKEGYLLLSGFFEEDVPDLRIAFESTGLSWCQMSTEDRWACLVFQKP
jgi:ribosomal protein L11 methyltransferase